ncbi:recombinase family protein [Streptomyces massasporeus]|uniref:recombinase family protein n=1 Tax=Streptomyces massasporeus TaxID=67324 RepID=UPI0036CAD496
MARKVGVYTRISRDDEGEALGVARQQRDCERLADLRSWQVVKAYEDNDVSAFKRNVVRDEFKPRPRSAPPGALPGSGCARAPASGPLGTAAADARPHVDRAGSHESITA